MSEQAVQYGPFPVVSPEQQTEQHREQIRFLEEARASGFRPCKLTDVIDGEYQAENDTGRDGLLLYRGHHRGTTAARWEVALSEGTTRVHAFWTDAFEPAASAVLVWLRGRTAADVFGVVEGHVIRGSVVPEPTAVREQPTW